MDEVGTARVSVIIPVYNAMPYLTGTLESVLGQTLDTIEVIAVDDGSTDGSGDELDRFAALDQRVTVVHQPNSGWPGMPRNRGLELARGEFVFFMDSDDTMPAGALADLVAMAESDGADVAIPRFAGVGGRAVQSLFATHPQGDISLGRAMETLSPQKLFRRSCIDELRFPEGRVRLEDGIFVTAAYLRARRIVFCGAKPLYFIAARDDGQNISKRAIDPENYVSSCRMIAELLLAGVPDERRAHRLVAQFFQRKGLRFYAPKRWAPMSADRRAEWVGLHRRFLRDLLPPEYDAVPVKPADVEKMRLIRAGDIAAIDKLVAAEHELDHEPRAADVSAAPGGLEMVVSVRPRGADSLLQTTPGPERGRLRAADRVHRILRPTQRWRIGRGISRRLERAIAGGRQRVQLYLAGRRVGKGILVPGRPTVAPAGAVAGATAYRFVLPNDLLRRFNGDRADLWTITAVDVASMPLFGDPVRVQSAAAVVPEQALCGVRVFATAKGNLSFDLRRRGKS